MNNLAVDNPFKYIEENLNVNLLQGISTSLIDSGVMNMLQLYCFNDHCFNNELEGNTIMSKKINDIYNCNIQIKISDTFKVKDDCHLLNKHCGINKDRRNMEHSTKGFDVYESYEDKFNQRVKEDEYESYSDNSECIVRIEIPINPIHNLKSEGKSDRNENSDKIHRWGYKQDKILWKVLKELEENSKESYDTIISVDSKEFSKHKRLISSLCKKAQWKGNAKKFLGRIKKIVFRNKFSFREIKKLKILLRKGIINREIDIISIAKEFPGKEKSLILSEIKRIKSQYKIMKNIFILESEAGLNLKLN